jgi:branched-chain amino acid aminotransferase
MPLPFRQRARLFIEGIKVMVPSHRRTPPESLTPRAKTHNYLNLIVANQEIHAIDPSAWAILLDANGNLCEGLGSNIFVVRHGEIFTPREKYVLPGVSRQTAIDLAHEARLTVTEADLDLYDAYNADEVFITSTSLCLCPAVSVNGVHVGPAGQVWGPITKKLVDAYIRFVNFDFVAQYLKFFDEKVSSTPF